MRHSRHQTRTRARREKDAHAIGGRPGHDRTADRVRQRAGRLARHPRSQLRSHHLCRQPVGHTAWQRRNRSLRVRRCNGRCGPGRRRAVLCRAATTAAFWAWSAGCLCRATPASAARRTPSAAAGVKVLLFARVLPGLSVISAPLAGISGVSLVRFVTYAETGTAIWIGR